jgi:hypothetical protein
MNKIYVLRLMAYDATNQGVEQGKCDTCLLEVLYEGVARHLGYMGKITQQPATLNH